MTTDLVSNALPQTFFVYGTFRDDDNSNVYWRKNWIKTGKAQNGQLYGFKLFQNLDDDYPFAIKTNNNNDIIIGRLISFNNQIMFRARLKTIEDIEGYSVYNDSIKREIVNVSINQNNNNSIKVKAIVYYTDTDINKINKNDDIVEMPNGDWLKRNIIYNNNINIKPTVNNNDNNDNNNDNDIQNDATDDLKQNDLKLNDLTKNDLKNDMDDEKTDVIINKNTKIDIKSRISSLTSCPLMIPFWGKILQCSTILLAGCGGGYDIFQGIPLYFALKHFGCTVYLANYTLTHNIEQYKFNGYKYWDTIHGKISVYNVNYKLQPDLMNDFSEYFPEYYLSKWFAENEKEDVSVYTFPRWGVHNLTEAYDVLCCKLNIDCVMLVDGGTDSLMCGTEFQTGTICEDYTSMFAVHLLNNNNIKYKIHSVLGLGVDRFHGTSDVSSWRAIAELKLSGGFLGSISLMNNMKCVSKYKSASEYTYNYMQKSIVATSICDAISGRFGNYHSNNRTKNSKLFINPAMSFYFIFTLSKCIDRIHPKYLEFMKNTKTNDDAGNACYNVKTWLFNNNQIKLKHEEFPKTNDH